MLTEPSQGNLLISGNATLDYQNENTDGTVHRLHRMTRMIVYKEYFFHTLYFIYTQAFKTEVCLFLLN